MAYFRKFPSAAYQFGNEVNFAVATDLTPYINLIDQIKDDTSTYESYFILDGDRPDQVSQKLYDTTDNYWTFYFLNDKLRRQGWPLSYTELVDRIKLQYPNRTLVIREHLGSKFQVGHEITGSTSGATGVILRRNLDLGQIIVKPTNNNTFQAEVITNTIDGVTVSSTVSSTSLEYLSAHHYEDTSGKTVDIDPTLAPGASLVEITYQQRFENANESLRDIKVFKPDIISTIITQFQSEL